MKAMRDFFPSEPERGLASSLSAAFAFAAALVAAALAVCLPATAQAATLSEEGFGEVPADTVSIDYPLKIDDAEFTATNDSFVKQEGSMWGSPAMRIVHATPVKAGESVDGSFTLFWEDAGIDDDGESIDVRLTVSNVLAERSAESLVLLDDGVNLCLDALTARGDDVGVKMQVDVSVLKHGTDEPAAGTMLVSFSDIDIPKPVPRYSEQVELLSGFGDTVWVTETNFLDISEQADRFTATKEDQDTYDSGFVTTADPAGFSLRWQGDTCGTYVLMPFRANDQIITATAGKGGTISDPGETFVRWKNDKTYVISPDRDFRILDVLVDGQSKGPIESYTFERVTESHTIEAIFEELPVYEVCFEDGFGNVIGTQQVHEGQPAEAPADPEHDGWAFDGWDKDFSNVTEDLVVTALWEPLIVVRVPALLACTVEADGSVIEPADYAFENLSPVAVELTSASTTGMPSYGSYEIADESGSIVHSYEDGKDVEGEGLVIAADEFAPLTWSVGDIPGGEAQELLAKALKGPADLCEVLFSFRAAEGSPSENELQQEATDPEPSRESESSGLDPRS